MSPLCSMFVPFADSVDIAIRMAIHLCFGVLICFFVLIFFFWGFVCSRFMLFIFGVILFLFGCVFLVFDICLSRSNPYIICSAKTGNEAMF